MLLNPLLKWALGGSVFITLMLGLALVIERQQNDKLKIQIERCTEARKADRTAYEKAQSDAVALNLQNVRKIEQQQKAINDEVTRDLNARLERLRRELRERDAAAQGGPGSAGSPQGGGGPAAPGQAGLCLEAEELLRAAENEERHDQLITTVERLMGLLNSR